MLDSHDPASHAPVLNDLGPLAWVFEELRKSLDSANKAIRRFLREHEQSRQSDLEAVDASALRMARQQIHQAVGALEVVGLAAPAQVLRGMEAAVQRFVQRPLTCTDEAAAKVERASFALIEFLEAVLNGKTVHPVGLFPQYRDVQEIAGAERVHPADLWPLDPRGVDLPAPSGANPLQPSAALRSMFDRLILLVVKTQSLASAQQLARLCTGLAAGASHPRVITFWRVAAAHFEAIGHQLVPADLYAKRATSRVLLQFNALSQPQPQVSETLLHDMLFFCAQAEPKDPARTPQLVFVRKAYGIAQERGVDYHRATLGQYDPALLVQARKRINAAKEAWSLFSGGDRSRGRQVQEQFGLIGESLLKLHPASQHLASTLVRAAERAVNESGGVSPELAMEVATTTLYLEAVFEDFDPQSPELTDRTQALAQRLQGVLSGEPARPLDPWMEQLYRRVSDRQTMGSVVGELKVSLGEIEKSLDQFFRTPDDKSGLHVAVAQLTQMRGVLSVLGLDHAVQTVARMRTVVEQILDTEVDESQARGAGTFQNLGNNLSALSFLVDMLNYQPALAKKLFRFDDAEGELKPVMGRTAPVESARTAAAQDAQALHEGVERIVDSVFGGLELSDLGDQLDALASQAALAEQPAVARAAREAAQAVINQDAQAGAQALVGLTEQVAEAAQPPAPPAPAPAPASDDADDDLLGIFLEEAREVVANGSAAVQALADEPGSLEHLTTLRRAFHTLKGSSRMVGLNEFGEAAWQMEQLLNAVLAEQKPASPALQDLARDALIRFGAWVEAIADHDADGWSAQPFRASAQALKDEDRFLPLGFPVDGADGDPVDPAPRAEASLEVPVDNASPAERVVPMPPMDAAPMLADIDFAAIGQVAEATDPAPSVVPPDEAAEALPDLGFDLPLDAGAIEVIDAQALVPSSDGAAEMAASNVDVPAAADRQDAEATEAPRPVAHDEFIGAEALEWAVLEPGDEPEAAALVDAPAPASASASTAAPATVLPGDSSVEPPVAELAAEPVPTPDTASGGASGDAPADVGVDAPAETPVDEQTRVIGSLHIPLKLYNVYLNEADEWSRRLNTALVEWSLEQHEPIPSSCEAWAHSLAGSSATVGFDALSQIARALEHAIGAVALRQADGIAPPAGAAPLFVKASDDVRRLLHQFAAGFLKEPDATLLAALHDVLTAAPSVTEASSAGDALPALPSADEPTADEPVAEAAVDAPLTVSAGELIADLSAELAPVFPAAAAQTATPTGAAPLAPVVEPSFAVPTAPVVPHEVQDIDDDIDAVDSIDIDLFPIFEEEAQELLPKLAGALRQWVARPDNASARVEVLRNLHTLKGSARLAGALRLGEMAHRMETSAERLTGDALSSADLDPLVQALDGIQTRFDVLRRADHQVADLVHALPESPAAPAPVAPVAESPAVPAQTGGVTASTVLAPTAVVPVAARAGAAVRVRPELLDRLVNQTGEVMITRSRMEAELVALRSSLKDLTGNLDRLRGQLRDIELQAETQMQSRLAQARDADQSFDPLEFDRFTRVQELTRMMAESVNDVATVHRNLQRAVETTEDNLIAQARQTRELQRDLLRTRMVEFEGISERLYRVVRQASKETGKQVRLDITGGQIEMDRGVLDRMTAAFEHLLRNHVAHGIEAPDVRLAKGKPAEGQIEIRLAQELNDVSVVFSDDGAGLDLPRLREKGRLAGIVPYGAELADDEAAQLIFEPGISTAQAVSELAGRGIGMDVVRSDVLALGGRIVTATEAGRGTSFTLVLPLTTAVTQVVMVRAGDLTLGVPSNLVELVRRVSVAELEQAYATGQLTYGSEQVPFYWSGALLQHSPKSLEAQARTLPVVVFRSAAQRVAMHVDEVLGSQEVVVKNLGAQLSRLPGLAGMSVLASGAVALIYNPVALAAVYGAQVPQWVAAHAATTDTAVPDVAVEAATTTVPLVLVVDDSITVRRVTQRLLQREGYRVALAADGLQALERLQSERPAVVLSDIEMPRMDGFDLVRNIRADAALAGLPVIMITSRIAEKHREHARELGVDHYLGKPYSEDDLLALVSRYAKAEAAAT